MLPSDGEARADEAYAADNGRPARVDSATTFLLLGPTTECWQDAINDMVKKTRCYARRANKYRSVQQWADLAYWVQNSPTVLWTEIVGGATICSATAARQRQQVENLAVLLRTFDSPGKVILINHTVLTHEMKLQHSP